MIAAPPDLVDQVIERTKHIAAIPAPPLDEGDRADVVQQWLDDAGCADVERDDVGNVWGTIVPGRLPAIAVCAHLDTVFPRTVNHLVRHERDRLVGPSVGDDSVALAALASLRNLLPGGLGHQVVAIATIGEEGIGDLTGVRHALNEPKTEIGGLIAIEGNYLGRIGVTGVGSVRWSVGIDGPGGHAWERADTPSAVHRAGEIIARLGRIPERFDGRVAVNVGRVSGGEAINARAQHAELEVDLRADDDVVLRRLVGAADTAVRGDEDELTITIGPLGDRPAGRIDPEHPLVRSAIAGYGEAGVDTKLIASSTDANAAFALGIPAIAVGVAHGALEHTEREWIDLASLGPGLAGLRATIIHAAGVLSS